MLEHCTSQKSTRNVLLLLLLWLSVLIINLICINCLNYSYLRWQEIGREEGISIAWQSITLHAISSEPVKCIYIMLDVHIDYPPSQGNGQMHANNGNDEQMAEDGDIEDDDDDEGTCVGKFDQ